ncbi:MAG: hypothetical protein FWC67_02575 [Defluviitaleaceae bacterium]|nr:hypothetical protein [Defluviitaleaceae bacterium]
MTIYQNPNIPPELLNDETWRNPPQLGCMHGKIKETDDHDWFEPLDDFEEYM